MSVTPVPFDLSWTHLSGLTLADPSFGEPRRVDILLGIDVFVDILRHGRRAGPAGSPVAIETEFGWAVCGGGTTSFGNVNLHVASHYASTVSNDDIHYKFREIKESPPNSPALTVEECSVVQHFKTNHSPTSIARFIVPFPRRPDAKPIGESRSQAVSRFLALEHSLCRKNKFAKSMLSCRNILCSGTQKLYQFRTQTRITPQCSTCLCMSCTRTQAPPPESELFLLHLPSQLQAFH